MKIFKFLSTAIIMFAMSSCGNQRPSIVGLFVEESFHTPIGGSHLDFRENGSFTMVQRFSVLDFWGDERLFSVDFSGNYLITERDEKEFIYYIVNVSTIRIRSRDSVTDSEFTNFLYNALREELSLGFSEEIVELSDERLITRCKDGIMTVRIRW